jgi:tetratricopeptide (TPR) repeat protein
VRLRLFAGALCLAGAVHAGEKPLGPLSPDPDLRNPMETYMACLELTGTDAERAFEMAGKWRGLGGGEPAEHCAAVALIGLDELAEAGTRLEELAERSKQNNNMRASMLSQAGQAWYLFGLWERAHANQTEALKLVPKRGPLHVEILLDRAMTLAGAQNYWQAIDDLNEAISIDPNNSDAYAFRASAYRYVDAPELALEDAERAVKLEPTNPNALLERGNQYRLQNRNAEARADWLAVLQTAPETSDVATAARANIEKLDFNPDAKVP